MLKRLFLAATLLCAPAAAHAAWHEASSPHFIVYSDENPEKLKAFAVKLERFDRVLRYRLGVGDPELGPANKLVVYVVPDIGAIRGIYGKGGSNVAGFYMGAATGSIAFVPRRAGINKFDINADTVFFHEYAHHFMFGNFAGAWPAWFVEGFAEFYSTTRFEEDGKIGIGLPALHRAYDLNSGQTITLSKMLGASYARLSSIELSGLYARGWLLTHYLEFNDARKGQLQQYLKAVGNGRTGTEAAIAFGDLAKLDRELNSYMRQRMLNYRQITPKDSTAGKVEVRVLSPGEAAFIATRMRSVRGVDIKQALALVPNARRVAVAYPNDPTVQAALAEVEHDARNYAEAEAAADRALAVDPKNIQAMIYKGRIRMSRAIGIANPGIELAAPRPKPGAKIAPFVRPVFKNADAGAMRDARGWFAKASKVDPEDPEPKLLYHATYAASGASPTKNAADALIYALVLAPQDTSLRVQVARQLIVDGKAAEARQTLAPVAYNPHSGTNREWVTGIMTMLAAGNVKGALAVWDEGAFDSGSGS